MFKKPLKIKSNNQLKGSDRKTVKDLFCASFPNGSEAADAFFNNKKDPINCLKLVTHDNIIVQLYTLQKQPLFFCVENKTFPTVHLLWKYPDLVPHFTTHPQVTSFITSGADLMLPGLVTPPEQSGLRKYGNVTRDQVVYVNLSDNRAAIAVGVAFKCSEDLELANNKGKCVIVRHYWGDHICSLEGHKNTLPDLGPPIWLQLNDYETDFPLLVGRKCNEENEKENLVVAKEEELDEEGDNMDELLHYCFLAAVKYSKNLSLPVLVSNFFKLQMLPMCPPTANLDLKKTSYKKLKPFLDEMARIGLIGIEETKKGVETIATINKEHPKYNEFYLRPEDRPRKTETEGREPVRTVTESFVITANVLPLFVGAGYRKGDTIEGPTIRKLVTEYVKSQDGCSVETGKLIRPSTDTLVKICKTSNPISWEELFERVRDSMKSCFKVNSTEVFSMGKASPITMSVSVRSGNKKVTLIDNLETFGININEFAKECQHGVAASTSRTPAPPGKKCDQLLVQGNQVVFINNLLLDKYKIPKKYIRGAELAPKKRK